MTIQECREKWESLDKTSLPALFEFLGTPVPESSEAISILEYANKVMNVIREQRIKTAKMPWEVKVIEMTCSAPSQWEGQTVEGDLFLIRYRWGVLRVDLWGRTIYLKQINEDSLHGVMSWREMAEHLREVLSITSLPKEG